MGWLSRKKPVVTTVGEDDRELVIPMDHPPHWLSGAIDQAIQEHLSRMPRTVEPAVTPVSNVVASKAVELALRVVDLLDHTVHQVGKYEDTCPKCFYGVMAKDMKSKLQDR